MITFKKYSYLAFIIFLACFTTLEFNFNRVDADTATALKEAPAGININDYFTNDPTGYVNYFTHNGAKIVTGHNSVLDLASGPRVNTNSKDTGAGYGSYWSNSDKQNYIDLTDDNPKHPQTISAWLYFGTGVEDDAERNGEGMAFVIQNDIHKTAALGAGGESLGVYGLDQGTVDKVGPIPTYSYPSSASSKLTMSAIQKSVAIEFDSQTDDATKDRGYTAPPLTIDTHSIKALGQVLSSTSVDVLNGFDSPDSTSSGSPPEGFPDRYNARYGAGGGFGHIAFTYPGNPLSYHLSPNVSSANNSKFSSTDKVFQTVYSLIHILPTSSVRLVNDSDPQGRDIFWHHVTIQWTPTGDGKNAVLSYKFNDINPNDLTPNYDTNSDSYNEVENSTTVDYKATFGNDATKVLWGFTGANNDNSGVEDKLVDFESIPALLYINPDSNIDDNTEHKNIAINRDTNGKDLNSASQKTVGNGDDLTINYNLDYQSGRTNWKGVSDTEGIKAVINLPKYFDTVKDADGNIGTATFKDADGNIIGSENIPASESNGTVITHSLDHAIQVGNIDSNKISSISFAINGIADNPNSTDKTSAPAAATFTGSNNITNTTTPEFIVKGKQTYTLAADTPTSINLPYKGTTGLVLPVNLHYTGHTFSGDDPIYYTISINGTKYTSATTVNSTTADATDKNIDVKNLMSDDKFWSIFTNDDTVKKVYVTASDGNGVTSNKAEYDVHVIPDKTLELTPEDLEFGSTQGISLKKIMSRKKGFDLQVKSSNTPWYLYGTGTKLKDSNNDPFNGNLIYKKDDNTSSENLQNNLTFIDQHTDTTSSDVDIPVKDNWQNDTGVLLNNNGDNIKGAYQGEITWTLEDTPQK